MATVPMWIQHGDRDEAVPVSQSRTVVEAIKLCNGGKNLIYTEIKGANHGALERLFREDAMYNWLFTQVRTNETEVVMKEVPAPIVTPPITTSTAPATTTN